MDTASLPTPGAELLPEATAPLATFTLGEIGGALPAPERLYAERYRLDRPLADGGSGEVWDAVDTLTGEHVALKRIRTLSTAEIAAVRREVAALRWLRLPGVVQLRDEGVLGGEYFVVMDLVEGDPFLGIDRAGPVAWDALREPVLDLLEILAGVHVAGVVHLDLKPANVLRPPNGPPVILDFGLATGVALASGQDRPRGATIRYAAPEQLAVLPCDARTDLYALGVMLYEALAGAPPHGLGTWSQLAARRVRGGHPALASAGVPAEVGAVVDALLAPRPEDRPRSAHEVLRALGGRAIFEPVGLPERDAAGPEELRSLFSGPDLFLHLREDAAAVLWARTGGRRERVAEELGAWLRAGLARRDGERLLVDRGAIERLRSGLRVGVGEGSAEVPDGEEAVLRRLLAARAPGPEIVRAAREVAGMMTASARNAGAMGALDVGLAVARQEGDIAGERLLLEARAEVALGLESPAALDRVLPELTRAVDAGLPLEPVRQLIEGALLALTAQERRALAILEALPAFPQENLELWRQGARATAARRISVEEAERVLQQMQPWSDAGPRERAARLAGWWGNLRYQQGRFEEAAALHLRKAEGSATRPARMSALYNAAYALLDALQFDAAARVAEEVRAEAEATRHASFEARAMIVLRGVAYRTGVAGAPRPELVEASAALGMPWLAASFAFVEAAVAWRAGDLEVGTRFARRASEGYTRANAGPSRLLARTLEIASGAGAPATEAELDDLARAAVACPAPGMGLQALGMLRHVRGGLSSELEAAALSLAACRPRSQWGMRLELLSFHEALGIDPVRVINPEAADGSAQLPFVREAPRGATHRDSKPPARGAAQRPAADERRHHPPPRAQHQ